MLILSLCLPPSFLPCFFVLLHGSASVGEKCTQLTKLIVAGASALTDRGVIRMLQVQESRKNDSGLVKGKMTEEQRSDDGGNDSGRAREGSD